MEQTAHIFTPQDDSLAERINAYIRVSRDMNSFNQHLQRYDDDLLGDKKDIAQAQQILQHSLTKAYDAIEEKEMINAHTQGTVSEDDLNHFLQGKRQHSLQSQRHSSTQSTHSQQQS